MDTNFKANVFKKLIFAEGLMLMLFSLTSIVLFLCGLSVGFSIFLFSNEIIYPLILISFLVGYCLKAIKLKDHVPSLVLFGANLAISFAGMLAFVYKFGGTLENF